MTTKLLRFPIGVFLAAFAFAAALAPPADARDDAAAQKLPVTTSSAEAAELFDGGMVHFENHRWNLALADWNEATHLDPNFAQAYVWICFTTADPAEEARDRGKAKALAKSVTPGEKLLIRWMADVHENRYLEGIAAMNDMLAMYPHDKRLNFMAGYWLYRQDQYQMSEKLTLRALAEDPNYATCHNQLGYIYSRLGDIDKALEATAKYVELLPDQPNPHDSYGEMLRFAGRYDEALEQYRMALKVDPTFYISQKELGETYSLMGDEERARKEYEKAIEQAPSAGVKAEYLQKYALTYVREKDYKGADRAYRDAGSKAHAMKQWVWEARAYRIMGMYEPNESAATRNLNQASALLVAASGKVAQLDLNEERAQVLRVRVERRLAAHNIAGARELVTELRSMATSRSSVNTQRIYHGAAGALLVDQKQYPEAISHLEEDIANPLSMELLVTAYRKSGDAEDADNLSRKLRLWKVPGIEEALASNESAPVLAGKATPSDR